MLIDDAEGGPSAPLAEAVARYSGFRRDGVPPGAHRIAASSHVKLIVGLGPPFEYSVMADPTQRPERFRAERDLPKIQ